MSDYCLSVPINHASVSTASAPSASGFRATSASGPAPFAVPGSATGFVTFVACVF